MSINGNTLQYVNYITRGKELYTVTYMEEDMAESQICKMTRVHFLVNSSRQSSLMNKLIPLRDRGGEYEDYGLVKVIQIISYKYKDK